MTARQNTRVSEGLARTLSKVGYCSRSQAQRLVLQGRVTMNGRVVRDPGRPVRPQADLLEVDGRPVQKAQKVYLMMNKPRGLVTSASDERGRETVYSLLPPSQWLAPVGRLDKASEGLLLLTNDMKWADRVASPETHLHKTYHVQIGSPADAALLQRLSMGIKSEGEVLKAKSATVLRRGTRNCWLEIVLDEGKNRQIRRMINAAGIEVLRLVRVAIGPLRLGDLPKGSVRELNKAEKQQIDAELGARSSRKGQRSLA